ncbi:MAG: 4-alpha-glucanotransferase [Cyanobacteria bacterium PR.023]|nr:4-alpha-glucanotransferase [Cyanobacteria bacterium PR.023]
MARINQDKKAAGLLLPVFALRRKGDLGIGDTLCVEDAIDFLSRHNLGVLQILPVNETGGDNSPYNALSSIALDPLYISLVPDLVPGLADEMLAKRVPEALIHELSTGPVQYSVVRKLKLDLLLDAFENFEKVSTNKEVVRQQQVFADFCLEQVDWLPDYAFFRSLVDKFEGNACWTNWPAEQSTLAKARAWSLTCAEAKEIAYKQRFYSYVQWVAFSQWRRVRAHADSSAVELMGDIPFGVSRYSADVWCNPQLFDLQWSGGAPPEKFFQSDPFTCQWGQNWGIPLYNWANHEKSNYSFWQRRVKQIASIFHYFRIDHVLGFFRVYSFPWIPERNHEFVGLTELEAKELTGGELPRFIERPDVPAKNAKLNNEQGEKLLRMILAAAPDSGVVAEDLGMVPDYVRPCLKKLQIPGFTIPIFERVEKDLSFKPKETHEKLSLVTYGTHDHQPIRSFYEGLCQWWHGEDGHQGWLEVQRLMVFLGLDEDSPPESFTPELHRRMIEVLMECPSWLAVLMISDLFGVSQRFNEPGISGDSNWSQRLDRTLAEYEADAQYSQAIKWLDQAVLANSRQAKKTAAKSS